MLQIGERRWLNADLNTKEKSRTYDADESVALNEGL
jgi:hypothetical protein